MKKTYQKHEQHVKNKIQRAFLFAFPSPDNFNQFFEKESKSLSSFKQDPRELFINNAFKNNLIKKKTFKSFFTFLYGENDGTSIHTNNEVKEDDKSVTFSFSEIIDKILEYNKALARNSSRSGLILQLNKWDTSVFGINKINATLLSRLCTKFDHTNPKNRVILRVLAYYIGLNYDSFKLNWNYISLLSMITRSNEETDYRDFYKETEGVAICFSLNNINSFHDIHAVKWLKDEFIKCINDLRIDFISSKNIDTNTLNVLTVNIFKERGPSGDIRLFEKAISISVAIAHQMAVRWILSDYSTTISLTIFIYAGDLSKAKDYVDYLTDTSLKESTKIFLSDFAYNCARFGYVRALFKFVHKKSDKNSVPFSGIWEIDSFWSFIYYDCIPKLLEKDTLPRTQKMFETFHRNLFESTNIHNELPIISKLNQFSTHKIFLLEIVKVLMLRRLFHQANKIISRILIFDINNIVARTLRMIIYTNIGLETDNYIIFSHAFKQAINEGEYILRYCPVDEEFICEYGIVYWSKSMKAIKHLRNDDVSFKKHIDNEKCISYLKKADDLFSKGITYSHSGSYVRCIFFSLYSRAISNLLEINVDVINKNKYEDLCDLDLCFKGNLIYLLQALGFTQEDKGTPDNISVQNITTIRNVLLTAVSLYTNIVFDKNYLPNIKLGFCFLFWDFMPKLTYDLCKKIVEWLREALESSKNIANDKTMIYSMSNVIVQFSTPDNVQRRMEYIIKTVEKILPKDITKHPAHSFIDDTTQTNISKVKLMLLHLDEEAEKGYYIDSEE